MSPSSVLVYGCVYLLAVLAPLIPAIFIYKAFPDTKVSIGGPLSGLTLNAGGAFAAYVVTFLLSMSVMSHFRDALDTMTTPVYYVTGQIELVDENGNQVNDPQIVNGVTAEYMPLMYQLNGSSMALTVPVTEQGNPVITVGVNGMGSVPLSYPFTDLSPKTSGSKITLTKPVVLRVNSAPYNPEGTPPQQSGSRQGVPASGVPAKGVER